MSCIDVILRAMDEQTIARKVGMRHDQVRNQHHLSSNRVRDCNEFEDRIAGFYDFMFTRCVSNGGRLPRSVAAGRAKDILNNHYRRGGGDFNTALSDCMMGINGGLRFALDLIADQIKSEAVEYYIRDNLDRNAPASNWQLQKQVAAELLALCGPHLVGSIDVSDPARYARNIHQLIQAYVQALRQTSSVFRRL